MLIIFAIILTKKTCELFTINKYNENSYQNAGPLSLSETISISDFQPLSRKTSIIVSQYTKKNQTLSKKRIQVENPWSTLHSSRRNLKSNFRY